MKTFGRVAVNCFAAPPKIEIVQLESPTPLNELGIKGVGESGVIPMTAAIASAPYAAAWRL